MRGVRSSVELARSTRRRRPACQRSCMRAGEPDDEEVRARMKPVVHYVVAGTATLALAGTGLAADVLVYPPEGPVRGAAEQGFLGVLQLGQGAERRRSWRPAPAGAARPA